MKKTILFVLICVLVLLTTFWMKSNLPVTANPIPVPSITMLREDIYVTISYAGSVVQARVNGTYAFFVAGVPPSQVSMYYPVPPNASNISVKIDETTLDWDWNGTHYDTVIGNYPFINWTFFLMPIFPSNFTIKTYYEHSVSLIEGKYKFLYAMGTSRYRASPEEFEAYIKTYISKDVAPTQSHIKVYLVTDDGTSEPATYDITSLDEVWNVTYTEGNATGTKDFLVTIIPEFPTGTSMPFIFIMLTVAIAIYKRKLLRTSLIHKPQKERRKIGKHGNR